MTPEDSSKTELGDIALCLSGGGYRAAAFHLGTLKMLDKLKLLENVKMFSTVSGGTIVGASYAMWRIKEEKNEKRNFEDFYEDFYKFLKKTNVVEKSLNKLAQKRRETSKGKLSLICEAANIYEKNLPNCDVNFGDFFDGEVVKSPFKELIFNTTEFAKGNAFRFRASQNPNVFIGSDKECSVSKDYAKNVRLADIVAASSCFPSAFEPIIFPDDFAGIDKNLEKPFPVSLMDGGVYDNQGIASILLADKFKKKKDCEDEKESENENEKENEEIDDRAIEENFDFQGDKVETEEFIDFFIISDTNQRDDEMLEPHDTSKISRKIRDNTFSWLANIADKPVIEVFSSLWKVFYLASLVIGFLITLYLVFLIYQTLVFFGENTFNLLNAFLGFVSYFVPLLFSVLILLFFGLVFGYKRKLVNWLDERKEIEVKGFKFNLLSFAEKITVVDLANLVVSRITSLIAMSSSVFMKRIRGLQITAVKANPNRTERVAFNFIYDMNSTKDRPSLWKIDENLKPTQGMRIVAEKAEKIETTLWFESEERLKKLILCGEMTVCFSLLKFLVVNKDVTPNDETKKYYSDYQRIKSEWMDFKENYP